MFDADPIPTEQEALRHLERIAFQLAHLRLMLSYGCFGFHVALELGRLRDQITSALTVLDIKAKDEAALSLYYTVRQHRAGEDVHIRTFDVPHAVPNIVPLAWYVEWLRSTP